MTLLSPISALGGPNAGAGYATLPHNLEAEQALLGCLMFDNGVYERLPDVLRGAHFHEPFHQRLFDEIETAIRMGFLAEPTLLKDRFAADPAFIEFGGLRCLADLVDRCPPAAVAPEYARTVLDHARRRELMRIGGLMIASAPDPSVSPEETAEGAESAIYVTMEAGRTSQGVVSFAEALAGAVEMAANAYSRDGKLAGLATELLDLDRMLGGLHPSDLLILAGRPSMGKTALATNIAFNVARKYRTIIGADGSLETAAGGQVMFFSLEMSAEQLAMRILADASGVSSDKLRKGQIDASDFGRVRDAAVEIGESPLYIDATGGISIAKLAARARRQKRKTGLDLIIVDYLQLVTTGDYSSQKNRVQEVSEITGGLKALAKELNVPILALSQLSRKVEEREDKRPLLSDLRESGSIEQDADCVMFVYREAYYLERAEPRQATEEHLKWQADLEQLQNVAEVVIGKQRHGPIGTIRLSFDADTTKFGNLAREGRYRDPSAPQNEYPE